MSTKILALVALTLLLVACQDSGIRKRASSLDDAVKEYTIGLRWSMVDVIEHFHHVKQGEQVRLDRDSLDRVRVTGSSILKQTLNSDLSEAEVTGEITYYTTDSGTLKKMNFTQNWWYDEDNKSWYIGSDYLEFD